MREVADRARGHGGAGVPSRRCRSSDSASDGKVGEDGPACEVAGVCPIVPASCAADGRSESLVIGAGPKWAAAANRLILAGGGGEGTN